MTKRKAPEDLQSRGRPTDYLPEYCDRIVAFSSDGYSLASFAHEIGVARSTLQEWAAAHPEFSVAVDRAKAARARWYEERAHNVISDGGSGAQATLIVFGLKNFAPDDFADRQQIEHSGPGGGAMQHEVAMTPAEAYKKLLNGD